MLSIDANTEMGYDKITVYEGSSASGRQIGNPLSGIRSALLAHACVRARVPRLPVFPRAHARTGKQR